jgi:hypothetical protein
MIDGLKAPVLKDNEFLSSKAAFWSTIIYAGGSAAVSSKVTRSRVAAGQPPMMKLFF